MGGKKRMNKQNRRHGISPTSNDLSPGQWFLMDDFAPRVRWQVCLPSYGNKGKPGHVCEEISATWSIHLSPSISKGKWCHGYS